MGIRSIVHTHSLTRDYFSSRKSSNTHTLLSVRAGLGPIAYQVSFNGIYFQNVYLVSIYAETVLEKRNEIGSVSFYLNGSKQ